MKKGGSNRKIFLFILEIVVLLAFFAQPAFAKAISSAELIEKCHFYDGKEVEFQGEVIGDVMRRGEYAWININDDSYSSKNVENGSKLKGYNTGQSVWCWANQVGFIKYKGDYKNSGDIIWVKGIFNRACPEHGGDMDIHAHQIRLVKQGQPISHPFKKERAAVALFLGVISAGLFLINKFLTQKRQQKREQPL